jgi:hypothetical protein
MRKGYHCGPGRGFGYRHVQSYPDRRGYFDRLEDTLRYGWKYPEDELKASYYYCKDGRTYKVVVSYRRDNTPDGSIKGMITGFIDS